MAALEPVNVVLRDQGFQRLYGRDPIAADSEAERIKAHLLFVAQRIRQQHEFAPARPQRQLCAARLEEYAAAAAFPKHRAAPAARTPIFVDHAGTPCAVADLLLHFGGADLCRAVDRSHHNASIAEIMASRHAGPLQAWCEEMGLDVAELAMMQPGYSDTDQRKIKCLIDWGATTTAGSLLLGLGGLVLYFLHQRSATICVLAGLGCLQIVLIPVIFLIVDRSLWPGPNSAVALTTGCVLFPPEIVLFVMATVDAAKEQGRDASRTMVIWAVWIGLAILVVVYTIHRLRWKPTPQKPRFFDEGREGYDVE